MDAGRPDLTLFGRTLEELRIRHIRTQVNSPWTNGKNERFWGILQSELLDRQVFRTFDAAADGLTHFATYYNYDRLHGELDWHTPAERYDGTPFTARGFERVPALGHLQGWLAHQTPWGGESSGRVRPAAPGTLHWHTRST